MLVELVPGAEIAELEPEWHALYAQSGSGNPFSAPGWVHTWLRHFVPVADMRLLTVRRNGTLIGVAPCYLRRLAGLLCTVQLAGTARHIALTELPGVLVAPGEHRSVYRALVRYWCDRPDDWHWLELPLAAEHGWFEPDWLSDVARFSVQHKTTRPAVVLPLPADVDTLHGMLKRNVWESTRRARNRLDRSGQDWRIATHTARRDVLAHLPTLRRLHQARAGMTQRRGHHDALADDADFRFYTEAVGHLAAADRAELSLLEVAGAPAAAQLVLRGAETSYLSCSGLDPQWWQASPVTLLQLSTMERAVRRGDTELNLSVGVDTAKLRWSERVVQHPEFVVGGPGRRARFGLGAFAALAAVAGVRREALRHRPAPRRGRTSGE